MWGKLSLNLSRIQFLFVLTGYPSLASIQLFHGRFENLLEPVFTEINPRWCWQLIWARYYGWLFYRLQTAWMTRDVFVLVHIAYVVLRFVTWGGTLDKPKRSFVELQTQSLVKHLARVLLALKSIRSQQLPRVTSLGTNLYLITNVWVQSRASLEISNCGACVTIMFVKKYLSMIFSHLRSKRTRNSVYVNVCLFCTENQSPW